ncbi:hypothetical protein HK414_14270 [Ramlibacter terrae]|uniref:Uncharacterized protein n=1 Tax=Ramlibacter terrae TaxID=2732511 RepID=A0ABX6P352_9BURK|nr:hypothetical protein HK414_14270 [Ramlibacter terrae]
MLMRWARRLFQHYEDYHAYGPSRLKTIGILGAITYCIFYFMRFTRPNASLTADLAERALAVILFAMLGLRDYWPERLKPYYIRVSYFVLLYSLPCFTVLVALQRGGGVANISNAFIILCFPVLLTDWRNTLVMLAVGTGAAAAFYWATTPNPKVPMDWWRSCPPSR